MTAFVTVIFVMTYVGMAAGPVPGLRIDRTCVVLVAAVALVVVGAIAPDQVADAYGNFRSPPRLCENVWSSPKHAT